MHGSKTCNQSWRFIKGSIAVCCGLVLLLDLYCFCLTVDETIVSYDSLGTSKVTIEDVVNAGPTCKVKVIGVSCSLGKCKKCVFDFTSTKRVWSTHINSSGTRSYTSYGCTHNRIRRCYLAKGRLRVRQGCIFVHKSQLVEESCQWL